MDLFYSTFEKTKRRNSISPTLSKQEETSLESSGMRQGVFSHYLIDGLKGACDLMKDRIITIRELYDYVYANVKKFSGNARPLLSQGIMIIICLLAPLGFRIET